MEDKTIRLGDQVMYVRAGNPFFLGAIGEVVDIYPSSIMVVVFGRPYTGIKVRFPRKMPWNKLGKEPDSEYCGIVDLKNLVKIQGPEGTDETLTWKSIPKNLPIKTLVGVE